jgi:hypothetical protein
MAGQGEMFQELEEKRREDGFFPKLHKAGQPNRKKLRHRLDFFLDKELLNFLKLCIYDEFSFMYRF